MQEQAFGIHRSWIILTLAIASMVMLFAAASAATVYLNVFRNLDQFNLPWLFYFNTGILLTASFLFARIPVETISPRELLTSYLRIFILSLVFLILQAFAWHSLVAAQQTGRAANFLYLLSGLHFAHVLGGLPFLAAVMWRLKPKKKSERLLKPEKRTLRLLRVYWHFLDLLWIYLIVFLTAVKFWVG